jgi:hypothetical protein
LHGVEDGGQVGEHDPILLGHGLGLDLQDLGLAIDIHEPILGSSLDEPRLRKGLFHLKRSQLNINKALGVASFSLRRLSYLSVMASSFLTINSLKVSWNANEEA